jgi:hypothetical protein
MFPNTMFTLQTRLKPRRKTMKTFVPITSKNSASGQSTKYGCKLESDSLHPPNIVNGYSVGR